jgi:hypothetical protein
MLGFRGEKSLGISGPGVTLLGEGPTVSTLKHLPLGHAQIAIVHSTMDHLIIRDLGFNGNWGATVGITDTLPNWQAAHAYSVGDKVNNNVNPTLMYRCITAGTSSSSAPTGTGADIVDGTVHWIYIGEGTLDPGNQVPGQIDPKNRGVFLEGCKYVAIESCFFSQMYGDAIHVMAAEGPVQSEFVSIRNCHADIVARNAVTLSGVKNVQIDRCSFTNIRAGVVDTETGDGTPASRGSQNVHITHCRLGSWWVRKPVSCVSVVGANQSFPSERTMARGYRIMNCVLDGQILVSSAVDCELNGNRIVVDTSEGLPSPIKVDHVCDDIRIVNNYIYDRAGATGGHKAVISVRFYGPKLRPQNVVVRNNQVHVRTAGVNGIEVDGCGGAAGDTGTATGVSATTLDDSNKSLTPWTSDQFVGFCVRMGGRQAVISSNTATQLTLLRWATPPGRRHYDTIGRRL